jgi:ribosomal protein S18 acetylase RimI-like enzyme
MSDITIRRATLDDVERAAALGAEIVKHHHRTDPNRFFFFDGVEQSYAWWLRKEIERPEAVVLLAEQAGLAIGYAYGAIEERDWSILIDRHGALHDLFVVPEARRTGVGKTLVAALIDALKAQGATLLVLRVMVQNDAARRLAESFGFFPTMLEMSRTVTDKA